jgi:hypothetical protein
LIDWFSKDTNIDLKDGQSKLFDVPALIIDDEADAASVNASRDIEEIKTINKLIRTLLNVFDQNTFIGYTATPYANLFISQDYNKEQKTSVKGKEYFIGEDLFPRDFIVNIKGPSNYIGAAKIFGLENLLRLDELGYHYIKNVDHVKIGKLPVIHGDTVFRRGSGVSPARTLWMRTKVSCIASHVHRSSSYSSKNFNGEQTTCWTTGMLMHPNVEYAKHVDEYNSGFAIIDLDQQGNYFVDNKKIYKGKVFNA